MIYFLIIVFLNLLFSINLEWIQGDGTAKYVTKYITKGSDLALVKIQSKNGKIDSGIVDYNEFEEIRLGVYRTASEAMLGIYGHKIFSKSHRVETLFIHQKDCVILNSHLNKNTNFLCIKLPVICHEGFEEQAAKSELARRKKGIERRSKLTAYFELNNIIEDDERLKYTYATVSRAYRWNMGNKEWVARKFPCNKIVRVGSAAPGNTELQV